VSFVATRLAARRPPAFFVSDAIDAPDPGAFEARYGTEGPGM